MEDAIAIGVQLIPSTMLTSALFSIKSSTIFSLPKLKTIIQYIQSKESSNSVTRDKIGFV